MAGFQVAAGAYFTHNYQLKLPFDAATVGLVEKERDLQVQALGLAIEATAQPGMLRVKEGWSGDYSLSLHDLNGACMEARRGAGPAEFRFPSRLGGQVMRVLRVKRNGHAYARPVFF